MVHHLRGSLPHRGLVYLPEPGPLEETESRPEQLQGDVPRVEDLQEDHQRLAEHAVQQHLVHVDVQHVPAMQVVQEQEAWTHGLDEQIHYYKVKVT